MHTRSTYTPKMSLSFGRIAGFGLGLSLANYSTIFTGDFTFIGLVATAIAYFVVYGIKQQLEDVPRTYIDTEAMRTVAGVILFFEELFPAFGVSNLTNWFAYMYLEGDRPKPILYLEQVFFAEFIICTVYTTTIKGVFRIPSDPHIAPSQRHPPLPPPPPLHQTVRQL